MRGDKVKTSNDIQAEAAGRTLRSILIRLSFKLAVFDTKEIRHLFEDDTICIDNIELRKTAVFVSGSDTGWSMDMMANMLREIGTERKLTGGPSAPASVSSPSLSLSLR